MSHPTLQKPELCDILEIFNQPVAEPDSEAYWYMKVGEYKPISYGDACDILCDFRYFLQKRHIARNLYRDKYVRKALLEPIGCYFETFEPLLHIMKLYLEDVYIDFYVIIQFSLQLPGHNFNGIGFSNTNKFEITISESGVYGYCFREQVREIYDDVMKNPLNYYNEQKKTYLRALAEPPSIKFDKIERFRVKVKYDKQPTKPSVV